MDTTSLAYIAGILDGEGHITVTRVHAKGRPFAYFEPRVEVSMTHRGVIQWLCDQYGVRLSEVPRRKPHHKDAFLFRVSGVEVGPLLSPLLPYLRVKRARAEAVCAFISDTRKASRWQPVTEAEYADREAAYLTVKAA